MIKDRHRLINKACVDHLIPEARVVAALTLKKEVEGQDQVVPHTLH